MPELDAGALREKLEELKKRVRELESEVGELRSSRDALNAEVRNLFTQIKELTDRYKNLKDKYLELRVEREQLYNEIQKLKNGRNQIREDVKALIDEIKLLMNEVRELQSVIKSKRRAEVFELKDKLEKLEWTYQTKTMDPEEEKALVERIRGVELQLRAVERCDECLNTVKSLRAVIAERRGKLKEMTDKIKELSTKYLEVKEKYMKMKPEVNELRSKIGELIEKRGALRKKADDYHNKYVEKAKELQQVRGEVERVALLLKAAELSSAIERKRAEMYEVARRILEKYKRGEKLTLDEFKLLVEFNLLEYASTSGSS